MRILVTGSRDWTDRDTLVRALVTAQADLAPLGPAECDFNHGDWTIVHGACPSGADRFAGEWAWASGYQVEAHPADWEHLGVGAGPARNRHMVSLGADMCLAFIKDGSKGASRCADLAEAAGIPTRRYRV